MFEDIGLFNFIWMTEFIKLPWILNAHICQGQLLHSSTDNYIWPELLLTRCQTHDDRIVHFSYSTHGLISAIQCTCKGWHFQIYNRESWYTLTPLHDINITTLAPTRIIMADSCAVSVYFLLPTPICNMRSTITYANHKKMKHSSISTASATDGTLFYTPYQLRRIIM